MMKKFLYVALVLLLSLSTAFANVNRIDPPNWWTGFENNKLQLMVYGDNITTLTPEINYEGVSITAITRAQSPNYLFIDLRLDKGVQAGTFDIIFKQGKKFFDDDGIK